MNLLYVFAYEKIEDTWGATHGDGNQKPQPYSASRQTCFRTKDPFGPLFNCLRSSFYWCTIVPSRRRERERAGGIILDAIMAIERDIRNFFDGAFHLCFVHSYIFSPLKNKLVYCALGIQFYRIDNTHLTKIYFYSILICI